MSALEKEGRNYSIYTNANDRAMIRRIASTRKMKPSSAIRALVQEEIKRLEKQPTERVARQGA